MLKVAAVQMEITEDRSKNLKRAASLVRSAAQSGASLVCLPEYFVTDCPERGMSPRDMEGLAETIPGPSTAHLAEVAAAEHVYVAAGTIIEQGEDGLLHNTCALLGPDGAVIGTYSKTHPEDASPKAEKECGIVPGDRFPVFETSLGKVAILIDMDIVAPEVSRILGITGAEIVCLPLNWSARWFNVIDLLPAAHALMNKFYLVVSNRVGVRTSPHGTFVYHGGSRVVSPEGITVGRADDYREGWITSPVDLDFLHQWRDEVIPRDYPYRRRPEAYSRLTEA